MVFIMQQIQKIIAAAGICSRRQAIELIKAGKVEINGEIAKIGDKSSGNDSICIQGKKIQIEQKLYFVFYKPRNVVTTLHDPQGRKTIKDYIKQIPARVYPVGRLDYDAEGLLLLTNDGDFANKITHPRYEKEKKYIVTLDKPITSLPKRTIKLKDGSVSIHSAKKINPRTVGIAIHEGRNKIVKRIFKKLGFNVLRLKRIQIGKIKLGNLKTGCKRPLTKLERDLL